MRPLLGLALVAWLADFVLVRGYGYYSDDWTHIVWRLNYTLADFWRELQLGFQDGGAGGRPLGVPIPGAVAGLGYRLGGTLGIYCLTYLGLVLNAALVLAILRRIFSPRAAFLGACAFLLFPADTTRPFLEHGAQLQTSLTLGLLALWLAPRTRLACIPAFTCLTLYEIPFLLYFWGAPGYRALCLKQRPTRKQLLLHVALCAGALVGTMLWRRSLGEARVQQALGSPLELIGRSLGAMLIGPWVSASGYPRAWLEALTAPSLAGAALCLALAATMQLTLPKEAGAPPDKATLLQGLLLWMGSYSLTLTHFPPVQLGGQQTSTHLAAAVGAAWLAAACVDLKQLRLVLLGLALTGSYQWGIQQDYVRAWALQKQFMARVLQLAPDLSSQDILILDGPLPPQPRAVLAHSWADGTALRNCLKTPDGKSFHSLMTTHRRGKKPYSKIYRYEGKFDFDSEPWWGLRRQYDPATTLILRYRDGQLERASELVLPDGTRLPGKPPGAASDLQLTPFGQNEAGLSGETR